MADSGSEPVPIETKDQLISDLESGCKPKKLWRIGTEHEKICFYKGAQTSPVPFEGEHGIEALLRGLLDEEDDAVGVYEDESLIGIELDHSVKFGATITLEPGGQVELSGAPLETIHQTKSEINDHLTKIKKIGERHGMGFLGNGFSPKFSLNETPLMPKGRYDVMRSYMPKVGAHGLNMMHQSATVQVNLDYLSEADMVRKFRVGLALQPVITALFANSVFSNGQLNGFQSFRSEIWRDVDPDRTGILPFVFEDGMGFERYVDYALKVPMYFLYRDGQYLDVAGESFKDFFDGKLAGFEGMRPTMDDWTLHLTTIFPEVRLKHFLEMRGADCGPREFLPALSAVWVGLLYETSALDAAYDMVKNWTDDQRQQMRDDVPRFGLKSKCGDMGLYDIASEVIAIAEEGLKQRAKLVHTGDDERVFLEPVQQIVDEKWALSDRLIDRFNTVWACDIEQMFAENSF